MREEKCSSQQIDSLEWHGTTAQGKVCGISLNRSLFCSSLAYHSKLSEHKQLGSRCRFCSTKLLDIREVDEEWGRALEVRKKQEGQAEHRSCRDREHKPLKNLKILIVLLTEHCLHIQVIFIPPMKSSCPVTEHNHHPTYKKQPINKTRNRMQNGSCH